MPYMQRITWSGVAMHAGVLPGYPASHGCIRMPMAFAMKMWNWTKMGARVVVTPGEITPDQLFASAAGSAEGRSRSRSQPTNRKPDAPPAQNGRQGSGSRRTPMQPAISEAKLELQTDRRTRPCARKSAANRAPCSIGILARTDPHRRRQRRRANVTASTIVRCRASRRRERRMRPHRTDGRRKPPSDTAPTSGLLKPPPRSRPNAVRYRKD